MTRTLKATALFVAIAVVAGAGCTVDKQDAPELSGPSELGTSVTLYASPDTLRQDGASQSQITIQAQDSKGQPAKNLPIRLDIAVGGTLADFGQLSGKNLVTGGDGRASVTYTAPLAPADPVDTQTVIQIVATPGGTDYGNATSRSVSIRLVPPGVILPPNGTPVPSFTFAPSAPLLRVDVTFDASLSTDSDGRIANYAWNFGDGSQGTGAVVKHEFKSVGHLRRDPDGHRRPRPVRVPVEERQRRGDRQSDASHRGLAVGAGGGRQGLLQRGDIDRRGGPHHRPVRLGLRHGRPGIRHDDVLRLREGGHVHRRADGDRRCRQQGQARPSR